MGLKSKAAGSESRFVAYVEAITQALGHADRAAPFRSYCAGLLLPGDRKSVEPMAVRVPAGRVQAAHQSLHPFVAFHRERSDVLVSGWIGHCAIQSEFARMYTGCAGRAGGGPVRAIVDGYYGAIHCLAKQVDEPPPVADGPTVSPR